MWKLIGVFLMLIGVILLIVPVFTGIPLNGVGACIVTISTLVGAFLAAFARPHKI